MSLVLAHQAHQTHDLIPKLDWPQASDYNLVTSSVAAKISQIQQFLDSKFGIQNNTMQSYKFAE